MAFKGTHKRPLSSIVNREIDSKGASWNAGTGEEYTSYYITSVWDNIEWSIEILADLLQQPLMDKEEVLKERGVIAEEIKMYQDNPMMGLSSEYYKYILGESDIGCWDIAGEVEEIMSYQQKDLINFRKKSFSSEQIVIVVAGNIENEVQVFDLVTKYWEELKTCVEGLPKVTPKWTEKKEKIILRSVEQGHYCVGVEGVNRSADNRGAFKIIETILVGNASSILFEEIREKRGWAYYITSISQTLEETGVLAIQSGVKLDKLGQAVELTEKIMMDFKDRVDENELSRAKDYLRGKIGLSLDQSDFWTSYVGDKWLLENKIETPEESLKRIEKVTMEEVKDLAKRLFRQDKLRKLVVKG